MSTVYSVQLACIGSLASDQVVFTARPSTRTVLRDLVVFPATDGQIYNLSVLHGSQTAVLLYGTREAAGSIHWEGRQVMEAGDQLHWQSQEPGGTLLVSGYEFEL